MLNLFIGVRKKMFYYLPCYRCIHTLLKNQILLNPVGTKKICKTCNTFLKAAEISAQWNLRKRGKQCGTPPSCTQVRKIQLFIKASWKVKTSLMNFRSNPALYMRVFICIRSITNTIK